MLSPLFRARLADDTGSAGLNIFGLTAAAALIVFGVAYPAISASVTGFMQGDSSAAAEPIELAPVAVPSAGKDALTANEIIARLRYAENQAFASTGSYLIGERLATANLATSADVIPETGANVLVGLDGTCYVILVSGQDTIRYYTTSKLDGQVLSVQGAVSADTSWCLNPQ